MWRTPGSVFRLEGFPQVTQPLVCLHVLFSKLYFFPITAFKREIIIQSVLTWLKILVIVFFLRNIRNAVSILAVRRLVIFYILQHGCKINSWLMLNSLMWYFVHLQSATKFCKICSTKCVQRTIVLYQYKLFNLFSFSVIEFCEVVMFKPWTQCVIEIRDMRNMRNLL